MSSICNLNCTRLAGPQLPVVMANYVDTKVPAQFVTEDLYYIYILKNKCFNNFNPSDIQYTMGYESYYIYKSNNIHIVVAYTQCTIGWNSHSLPSKYQVLRLLRCLNSIIVGICWLYRPSWFFSISQLAKKQTPPHHCGNWQRHAPLAEDYAPAHHGLCPKGFRICVGKTW